MIKLTEQEQRDWVLYAAAALQTITDPDALDPEFVACVKADRMIDEQRERFGTKAKETDGWEYAKNLIDILKNIKMYSATPNGGLSYKFIYDFAKEAIEAWEKRPEAENGNA